MLAVGLPPAVSARLPPLLWEEAFDVSHPSDPILALRAATTTRFDLIATAFPLRKTTYQDFLDEVRGFGSASRRAGLVAVVDARDEAAARRHIGRGLNRVVRANDSDAVLARSIRDLLDVAPRAKTSGTVRLLIDGGGGTRTVVTQPVNLSRSGMLLRGGGEAGPGVRFRFEARLESASGVVRGEGLVVRVTRRGLEGVDGIGVRFTRLDGAGGAIIDRLVAAGSEPGQTVTRRG